MDGEKITGKSWDINTISTTVQGWKILCNKSLRVADKINSEHFGRLHSIQKNKIFSCLASKDLMIPTALYQFYMFILFVTWFCIFPSIPQFVFGFFTTRYPKNPPLASNRPPRERMECRPQRVDGDQMVTELSTPQLIQDDKCVRRARWVLFFGKVCHWTVSFFCFSYWNGSIQFWIPDLSATEVVLPAKVRIFFPTRNKRNKVNKDTTDSKSHLKIGPNCPKKGKIIVFLSICRKMVQANEQLDEGVKYLAS